MERVTFIGQVVTTLTPEGFAASIVAYHLRESSIAANLQSWLQLVLIISKSTVDSCIQVCPVRRHMLRFRGDRIPDTDRELMNGKSRM